MRNKKTYIAIVIGMLFFLLLLQVGRRNQESINWRESYTRRDKIPYGTYVLYDRLQDLFTDGSIYEVKESAFTYLNSDTYYQDILDTEAEACYVVINARFDADGPSARALLDFVWMGNHAFIAAESFPQDLQDSLHLDTALPLSALEPDSSNARFLNPFLANKEAYDFHDIETRTYFSSFDSTQTRVLAVNNQGRPHLIRVPFGDGSFVLCSAPISFTNYYLLQSPMEDFVATALSHIPQEATLIWDEYYKEAYQRYLEANRNPMSYIFSQESLTWAFWLLLFSGLLYIIFESKRRQRIIPILAPLPNTTLEFTETMGRLYFQRQDHQNLARKKILIFLAFLRKQYYVRQEDIDQQKYGLIAARTGLEEDLTRETLQMIDQLRKAVSVSEAQLVDLTRTIDACYTQLKG